MGIFRFLDKIIYDKMMVLDVLNFKEKLRFFFKFNDSEESVDVVFIFYRL